jgi:hypothetical protein
MKSLQLRLFPVLVCLATAAPALAQGQFVFGNRNILAGIDAPIWGPNPAWTECVRLEGNAWLAQAYLGLTPDSLAPVGSPVPFGTGPRAGYITSHVVMVPYPGGTLVWVEMRVWEAAEAWEWKGDSYESAVASGRLFGRSNPIQLVLAEAPRVPPDMVGLQAFDLCIPEPSPLALAGFAALLWLARRRS